MQEAMFENIKTASIGILHESWEILDESGIYILLGLFIAGVIQAFVKKERIAKYLGQKNIKSVFYAALFGIPLPLCSCGVLPTAISLRKQGASKGATTSFLISTPETGVDSIAITYALIDPLMTVFRPVAAFITAMTAGIFENMLTDMDTEESIEENKDSCPSCGGDDCSQADKQSLTYSITKGLKYAFVEFLGDISKWLLIGIVLAGAISYLVPENIIESYLGYGWQPMIVMLMVGVPLYICASASTPIAAALIAKGMSPGVALVFLLTGPATNVASLIVVGKFLGKRSALIYLASICLSAIVLGITLNWIYLSLGIDIKASIGKAGEIIPHALKSIAAVILLLFMSNSIYHKYKEDHG